MLSHRKCLILFYLFEFEQNVRNTAGPVYPEYPTRRQNEGRFFTFDSLKNYGNEQRDYKTIGRY